MSRRKRSFLIDRQRAYGSALVFQQQYIVDPAIQDDLYRFTAVLQNSLFVLALSRRRLCVLRAEHAVLEYIDLYVEYRRDRRLLHPF